MASWARFAAKGAVILAGDTAWTDAMDASVQDTDPRNIAPGDDTEDGPRDSLVARAHRVVEDDLYEAIPVSRWAQSLLELPAFRRLDGVSLSDVPGELLFESPFPSRLAHSLGVYFLTRQARPRDRALQAAALAHDLGHGPFSHLSEPLMIEALGMDHEQRSAALLREAVMQAQGQTARLLSWLDLDEVCGLITGEGSDGRGALLNGLLDYDNIDHVARFALASGLREPDYDGRALARGLRMIADDVGTTHLALVDDLWDEALAWQADRVEVFQFLQSDGWNMAARGMLRKALDLAARDGLLEDSFFNETDQSALRILRNIVSSRTLVEKVLSGERYVGIWEADVPAERGEVGALFESRRQRLALEERVATESGLRTHELVAVYMVSRAERDLPPPLSRSFSASGASSDALAPERVVRLLAPAGIGQDYLRRARMSAERVLGALGAIPRGWPELR